MIAVREADLERAEDREAVLMLVDAYSRDPMGDGAPLSEHARERLIDDLRAHPTRFLVIAFHKGQPAGIAVCFGGYSTFAAKPLLNIHDLAVHPDFRGQGVSRHLLEFIAETARGRGCCKLTLEVLEQNERAREVYAAAGFADPVYAGQRSQAYFLTKKL